MEEEMLEKRYKKNMKVINETSLPLFVEDTFEDIFLAYKQDEKVIKEMAREIYLKEPLKYNNPEQVIDYFRKRCE